MLDTMLEVGGELGVEEVVIGMAHRGRLNVLDQHPGQEPGRDLQRVRRARWTRRKFMGRGDVKYHMGFSLGRHHARRGKRIHLSLAFNPSHLECVHPVVEGRVRAKQDRGGDTERTARDARCVIHGDAAFMPARAWSPRR